MNREDEFSKFPLILRKHSKRFKEPFKRFVNKSGNLNVQLKNAPNKYSRFTKDFANTLVSIRWRWVTLTVMLTNAFFYLCFAGFWMLDGWLSDDFNTTRTGNFCVMGANQHFTGYLLLSIETITTTGYGYLYPTENCKIVWITMTLSTLVMILIDGAFISVVFLKVCKPLTKDALAIFSSRAVICLRNGKLCLILRVYDCLNKHAIDTRIDVFVINRGWKIFACDVHLQEMEVQPFGMLLWPTDVVHEINPESPFWDLTAADLLNSRFEIVVTVSGNSLVTSQFSTSQTSYLPKEILWGYRFKPCMEYSDLFRRHIVKKYDVFEATPCDTPLCSASILKKIRNEVNL